MYSKRMVDQILERWETNRSMIRICALFLLLFNAFETLLAIFQITVPPWNCWLIEIAESIIALVIIWYSRKEF